MFTELIFFGLLIFFFHFEPSFDLLDWNTLWLWNWLDYQVELHKDCLQNYCLLCICLIFSHFSQVMWHNYYYCEFDSLRIDVWEVIFPGQFWDLRGLLIFWILQTILFDFFRVWLSYLKVHLNFTVPNLTIWLILSEPIQWYYLHLAIPLVVVLKIWHNLCLYFMHSWLMQRQHLPFDKHVNCIQVLFWVCTL
mgnify:CR=1 FL=1